MLSKMTLIVIRNKNGMLGFSKPCSCCLQYINSIGIKKIYYSGEDSMIYEKTKNMRTNHVSMAYRTIFRRNHRNKHHLEHC